MKNFKAFISLIVVVGIALLFALSPAEGATETEAVAVENFQGTGITWQPQVNYDVATLTIASSAGNVFHDNFEAGETLFYNIIDKQGNILPDGNYTYELSLIKFLQPEGELIESEEQSGIPTSIMVKNGAFSVQRGLLTSGDELSKISIQAINPNGNYFTGDGGFSGDLCLGCGDLANPDKELDIHNISEVFIRFDDTGTAVSTWDVGVPASSYRFVINDVIYGTTPFTIEENATTNTLYVKGAVIGIGTSTPVDDAGGTSRGTLYINAATNPAVILNQSVSSPREWQIFPSASTGNLLFRDETAGAYRLTLGTNGNVAVGTDTTPDYPLHVTGDVYTTVFYRAQGINPGFWLDESGTGNKGLFFALDNKTFQMQRRPQGFGVTNEASVFRMRIEAPNDSIAIDAQGDVGLGVPIESISYPLQLAGGARCTGTTWQNASSREYKENIKELSADEALLAFSNLTPVLFNYKVDREDQHLGFISEDVPDLVATPDRKGLSPMDIVAVLTKVVQEQQKAMQEQRKTISELTEKVTELEREVKLKGTVASVTLK
ncbi:MAG: tail fiber domain-containing protein [Nitrospirota bacterium]